MDNQNELGRVDRTWQDMEEGSHNVYRTSNEETGDSLRMPSHKRSDPHQRAHVNLSQDEYTPEEAARLLGTSLEVIIHAARRGDLKAERAGSKVVCIQHADLVDWLRREGAGV